MRIHSTRAGRILLTVGSFLAIAALACGGGGASGGGATDTPQGPQVDTAGTAAALQRTADALGQIMTQQAQVPPTPIQLPTAETVNTLPPPTSSGPTTYTDDFSSDKNNWEIFSTDNGAAQISGGVLLLGPFRECADVGQSSAPFGCFTQCLTCNKVSEYDMQVDAAYISGVTDRTFGMLLRFQDANGDGYVNTEDYYLDFELSIYNQFFAVYEHNTDGKWSTLDQRTETNIASGTQINTLRANSYAGGTKIDLYLNGTQVETVTVDPSHSSGAVGLVVGFRAMQAGFDNFSITLP